MKKHGKDVLRRKPNQKKERITQIDIYNHLSGMGNIVSFTKIFL
jgi:hypothetical protein